MINVRVVHCQVRSSTVNTRAMLRPTSGVAATRTQLQGTYLHHSAFRRYNL